MSRCENKATHQAAAILGCATSSSSVTQRRNISLSVSSICIQLRNFKLFAILALAGLTSCSLETGADFRGLIQRSKVVTSAEVQPETEPASAEPAEFPSTSGNDSLNLPLTLDSIDQLPPPPPQRGAVIATAALPVADGTALMTAHEDGRVLFWSPGEGQAGVVLEVGFRVEAAAFHRSEPLVAFAPAAGQPQRFVQIWSWDTKSRVGELARLPARITSLDFQPGGQSLLAGGADGRVYRWRYTERLAGKKLRIEGKDFERYVGHGTIVNAVAWHPGGRVFFSGDWKGRVWAWLPYDEDPHGGKFDENIFGTGFFTDQRTARSGGRKGADGIEQIATSADGQWVVLALSNGNVELWDVRGFVSRGAFPVHSGLVYSAAISPRQDYIATYGRDGWLRLWRIERIPDPVENTHEYRLEKAYEVELPGLTQVEFVDERLVAAGSRDGRVVAVNLDEVLSS